MTISSLQERLGDSAIGNNPILCLIAGIIFIHEQDYNEALKHTTARGTMDLYTTLGAQSMKVCKAMVLESENLKFKIDELDAKLHGSHLMPN
ncbi:coatomer subunit epsilon-1-like [Olea europaea subsp. europaea]|uniref:Coatomer subunit epsilon-1-like n=1 Tax=Olea europaea subsp. europaea TaxID=158383 RepID=A0A8S0PRN5_OLEEU|nr:coatomer subunit epsilon-1-like [Olea europaea subsp. europaea]